MALLNEIEMEVPIGAVKSIDEVYCNLDQAEAERPADLAERIKGRLARNVGEYITCSIGFAQNPLLAKMACKLDKPDGVTIWQPADRQRSLAVLPLDDVPGIGARMQKRLFKAKIYTMEELLETQPKHMRALWRSVTGERMWYALHGYAIAAAPSSRGMYGHGRVLAPDWRALSKAESCSRMLVIRAARRMRRDGWAAGRLVIWIDLYAGRKKGGWVESHDLPAVSDDKACLDAMKEMWGRIHAVLPKNAKAMRVGVTLMNLSRATERQLDWVYDYDAVRRRWETLTEVKDHLNRRYGKGVLEFGHLDEPPGGWSGAKISFTRIPSAEDFY